MQEHGYLRGGMFEPYIVSFCGIKISADWLSVAMWFGTFSSLGVRMQTHDLVCPRFVAQTMWFGVSNFCHIKGEWVEHGVEDHEVCIGNDV